MSLCPFSIILQVSDTRVAAEYSVKGFGIDLGVGGLKWDRV